MTARRLLWALGLFGGLSGAAVLAQPSPANQAAAAQIEVFGELTQGGWIRGKVPSGTVSAQLGDQPLQLAPDNSFFAAFDRDAGTMVTLRANTRSGTALEKSLAIKPRDWAIEHVNVARAPGGAASEAFLARRRPELERIGLARAQDTGSQGWQQTFIWPAPGRISGRFGSQRVYRGEPGAYHSGLDLAGGAGTVFNAPADGVVVLAANQPFSLEGHLIIVDHGQGLNSAFLHASEILVREGQAVKQGEPLGRIGATGRATGPHLHWSIKWRDARLDPLLFLPPRG
jgi:murein DD-endopeptidase MepM/ murein hydrolase activator NlpD